MTLLSSAVQSEVPRTSPSLAGIPLMDGLDQIAELGGDSADEVAGAAPLQLHNAKRPRSATQQKHTEAMNLIKLGVDKKLRGRTSAATAAGASQPEAAEPCYESDVWHLREPEKPLTHAQVHKVLWGCGIRDSVVSTERDAGLTELIHKIS